METKSLDIEAIRRQFPILDRKVYGRRLVYLDNTATSQTPRRVVEGIENMYYGFSCISDFSRKA